MKGMGNRPLGMILLGVYLILVGLGTFVAIPAVVTGVVALAAGILILLPLVRM